MSFKKPTQLLLLVLLLVGSTVFAQQQQGVISGSIFDSLSNQAIEFATVGLYRQPDNKLIGGVISQSDGHFSFDNIPFGKYTIRIQFIGFKQKEITVIINEQQANIELGTLLLQTDARQLSEVEVVGEKSLMTLAIDKKVYNVDKDLSVKGGTGIDAVKNIPSVSIDSDGSVTLRNSEVQIYIDGKQTELSLDQIPADQIDRIEVITNPSSKYDANTSGGLLNVILKKNIAPGYNGSVTLGIGTNQRYTPSLNLNVKKKPFNLTTVFSYNAESNDNQGKTIRDNYTNPIPIKHFEQTSISDFIRIAYVGSVNLDYSINDKNTISIGENYVHATYHTIDDYDYFSQDVTDAIYSTGTRKNDNKNQRQHYVTSLAYKKTYDKKVKEFNVSANYTYGLRSGGYDFNTQDIVLGTTATERQLNDLSGYSQLGTFQIDYTNPINDSSKIEFGVKAAYSDSRTNNTTSNYDKSSDSFLYDSVLSNDFLITENVNAAYVNYTRRVKKVDVQAGLRIENVNFTGEALNKPNQKFGYSYPSDIDHIFNAVFPALYLSKKLKTNNELQFNITRKLNRPRYYYLMPIVFFADKFNYRIGNPGLQPEFVNKSEINYNFVKPNFNYLTALYGQVTENSILYGAYQSSTDSSVLVNTFINGGISYTVGWENIIRITSIKNLTLSGTATPYYIAVNYVDMEGVKLKNKGFSLNSKFMLSYKLPKDFTIQLNGLYEAPKPIPQGNKTDLFFFDISLSKKIKKSFSFNLILSDVMNTKQRGTVYSTPDYYQYLIRRRESRYLKFTATWMFGKTDTKNHKQESYDE